MALNDRVTAAEESLFRKHNGITMWVTAEPEKFPDFKVRTSDVWVCSFPRSGTTVVQEIAYLVKTMDFETASTTQLDMRFPFVDVKKNNFIPFWPAQRIVKYCDKWNQSSKKTPCTIGISFQWEITISNRSSPIFQLEGIDSMVNRESPRFFKSHFHYSLLPSDIKHGEGKVIYVMRNAKSVVPSLYKLLKYMNRKPLPATLREFGDWFLEDKVIGCPWWSHVRQYWENRHASNILIVRFEDIVKDRKSVIRRIAGHLGEKLREDDVDKIFEHTKIENMKTNKMLNFTVQEELLRFNKSEGPFINTGKLDGWSGIVPEDLQTRIDNMVKEKLGDTGLFFE